MGEASRCTKMRSFFHRPLVCVTIAFAAGIALAPAVGSRAPLPVAAVSLGAIAISALLGRRGLSALALLLTASLAGALLYAVHQTPGASDVSLLPAGGQTIVGTVANAPSYSHGVSRFVLAAEAHEGGVGPEPVAGRLYVRLVGSVPVTRGQRWRLTGRLMPLRQAANPGQRSEAQRLSSLGVSCTFTVGSPALAQLLGEGGLGVISTHAFRAQAGALSALSKHLPGPYRKQLAAVAASVIFGVHAAPPPREITEVFRRAGTIHLLVVSGAMVTTVFGLVFLPSAVGAAWRRAQFERYHRDARGQGRGRIPFRPGPVAALAAVLVVAYYAVLTEGGQAVLRAAVMGALVGLALALRCLPAVAREHGLNVDRYTLLAGAALAVLSLTPEALSQPGFQLSFGAVLAILYLTPKTIWLFQALPKWLGYCITGTLAAQLATFPILVYHYGQAPIVGFAANLFAVPLATVVLVSGILTCALAATLPWLASCTGWICALSTRGLIWSSAAFAAWPWATVEVPPPSVWVVAAWYPALAMFGFALQRFARNPLPAPRTNPT